MEDPSGHVVKKRFWRLARALFLVHLRVVGVLVEALVEGQLEQLKGRHRARALVSHGADELEVAHGLGLREDVVQLVPHLSTYI